MPHINEIKNMFPFLPVVISIEPHFPVNREMYSKEEEWIVINEIAHYERTIWPALHKPDAVIPETYKRFSYSVDELIAMLDGRRSIIENNELKLEDYSSRCVNIIDHHRITVGQPEKVDKTVYVLGGCCFFGAGCPDHGTYQSHLQKMLTDCGYDYTVENYGAFAFSREAYLLEKAKHLPYRRGDILHIIFAAVGSPNGISALPAGCFHLDIRSIFERPHNFGLSLFSINATSTRMGRKSSLPLLLIF